MGVPGVILVACLLGAEAPPGLTPLSHTTTRPSASTANAVPAGHLPFSSKARTIYPHQKPTAELLADLTAFRWVLIPNATFDPLRPGCPWHHPAISALIERANTQPAKQTEITGGLRQLLADKDPASRTNAAIALSMLGQTSTDCTKELDRALLDDSLPEEVRIAALYQLAQAPQRLNVAGLRLLLHRWFKPSAGGGGPQRDLEPTAPTDQFPQGQAFAEAALYAVVRCALLQADYDPLGDADVQAAVQSGVAGMQRMAAISYSGRPWTQVPTPLVQLLGNESAQVRHAALTALCQHPTEAAGTVCRSATSDRELQVRIAAVRLLPKFPGEETNHRLARLMRDESAAIREACVEAAAELSDVDLVRRGADDSAQRVRIATARHLIRLGATLDDPDLKLLLSDRDPSVREAAITSLEKLPIETAAPFLLELLASLSVRERSAAQQTLAKLWEPASQFAVTAPPPLREQQLQTLRQLWSASPHAAMTVRDNAVSQPHADDRDLEQQLDRWLTADVDSRRNIAQQLVQAGSRILGSLNHYFEQRGVYPTSDFVDQVLAPLDPVFADIANLARSQPSEILQQTARLKRELGDAKLTYLQAVLLSQSLKSCPEPAAWLALAPLLESSHPHLSATLDRQALSHASRLVRARCWRRIQNRAQSWHEPLLRQALTDDSEEVRIAALDAAGFISSDAVTVLLVDAMRSASPQQRLAAARALHRQGDEIGSQELERLSFDDNPHVRLAIAQLMGSSPGRDQRLALRLLLRFLDDPKPEIVQAAVASLEELTGVSYAKNRFSETIPVPEQAKKWRSALKGEFQRQLEAN